MPFAFDGHGNFDQPVTTPLHDLSVPVNVHLQAQSGSLVHISGSPFEMRPIWEDLHYQRAFGGPASRKRPQDNNVGCKVSRN